MSTENSLEECVKRWMEQYKRGSIKPASYDRLETTYHTMLRYGISRLKVHNLTTQDLQNYVNRLLSDGYAQSTIKKQFHLISEYLNYALAEGTISRPIHKVVKLPGQATVLKKKRDVQSYSVDEQTALKCVLESGQRVGYYAALLMLETGMRVGEVLALKWCDVDWRRRALRIDKTIIRLANKRRMQVQEGAKSFASNRIIPLSTSAFSLLDKMRQNSQSDYIFAGENRMPISYEAMRYQIQQACEQANVEYKGQHVFRHTFATNCYHRGCDVKILSKLLGHADVNVTYNTYIHLYGDALEEMRAALG